MSDWIKVMLAVGAGVLTWYVQSQKAEFRLEAAEHWQQQHEATHAKQYDALDRQVNAIQRDLDQLIGSRHNQQK